MRSLLFAAAIAFASFGCKDAGKDKSAKIEHDIPEISIDEVATGIEAKTLTVVDCNSDKIRKRVGVLPGAILVEDEEAYPASVLPQDKAAKLVFYCGGPG